MFWIPAQKTQNAAAHRPPVFYFFIVCFQQVENKNNDGEDGG